MYLEYFGMREAPFGITPDTSFFCACASIQAALNTLTFAVTSGEGFIKITGEVGTGKTLLCRKFLASLPDGWTAAYIPNPNVNSRTFLAQLARELGCRLGRGLPEEHRLMEKIERRLVEIAAAGERAIVCIDEAQAMPMATMETLRLLSNLETEKRKLLQVVLFGQPELDTRLQFGAIRQLRQRITFEYRLAPLTRQETAHYLSHRLIVAGYAGGAVFSRPATRAIYRASRGVPRLVNILANKTLMVAYGRGRRDVRWRDAHAAARDTPSARRFGPSWLGLGGVVFTAVNVALLGGWLL
jgi:MSHA biogenesis protein MshM